MKKLTITALLAFSCVLARGGEIYNLTLDRSVDIAKKQSYRMQTLDLNLKIAQNSFKATMAGQRTSISMNLSLPQYNEGVGSFTDADGNVSFYATRTLAMNGNLRINQPLPTNGNIYIQTQYNTTNNYTTRRRDGRLNVGIGLTQPLDALYGYNNTRANIIRAKLDYELANKQYKRNELDLVYSVSSAYYSLLLTQERLKIAKLDLERQTEAADISARKYAAGLIKEVDALQMEVDLADAESKYDAAVLNVYERTNAFRELLGFDSSDSIVLQNDLSYKFVSIDPQQAVDLAMKNRLEVREEQINVEQSKLNLKQQKSEGLPKGNLEAFYGRRGVNVQDLDLGYQNALSNVFKDFGGPAAPTYSVGLTLSIPILDWGRNRARVRMSEARLEQSLLRQDQTNREIESQVRSLVSSIASDLRRLQILEKSVVVAEKSFDITLKRYEDGDVDSQAMASERTRLNNAYTTRLDAFINYQLSLIDLTRQTFYDFEKGHPIFD